MKTCVHKFSFLTRLSNYPDCVHLSPNLHTYCVHLIIFSFWGRSSQLLFKPAGECWKKVIPRGEGSVAREGRGSLMFHFEIKHFYWKFCLWSDDILLSATLVFYLPTGKVSGDFLCLCQPGPRGGEGWQFPVDNGPGRGAVTLANHWDTSDRWHLYGKVGLEIPKNI